MKKIICLIFLSFLLFYVYAQNGRISNYSYSSSPMKIMGFTKDTTLSQAKKQINEWKVTWSFRDYDNTIVMNKVSWQSLDFESIWITFDNYGKIKWIACHSPSGNINTIQSSFLKIVSNLPYRRMLINPYIEAKTYIYNGYDESEFAIYSTNTNKYLPPIEFSFYFNSSIYESGFNP